MYSFVPFSRGVGLRMKRSELESLIILARPPILARLKRRKGLLIVQIPGTTCLVIDLEDILRRWRVGHVGLRDLFYIADWVIISCRYLELELSESPSSRHNSKFNPGSGLFMAFHAFLSRVL